MGMDLITTTLAYKSETTLDWEAGRTSIRNASFTEDDVIESFLYSQEGEEFEEEEYKEFLIRLVDTLEEDLFNQYERSVTDIVFGDWVIVICGGSSWGESPSDLFDVISDLHHHWDEVLTPIGFDWPERNA